MKRASTYIVTVAVGILLMGCKVVPVPVSEPIPFPVLQTSEVPFEWIASEQLFGAGSEGLNAEIKHIKTHEEWNALLIQMSNPNAVPNHISSRRINFEKYDILCLVDKQRGTGGHSITITRIEDKETELFVYHKQEHPTDMATEQMTQPYTMVMIAKTNKSVLVQAIE